MLKTFIATKTLLSHLKVKNKAFPKLTIVLNPAIPFMDKNVNMFPTDPPEQVTREDLDQSSFLITTNTIYAW